MLRLKKINHSIQTLGAWISGLGILTMMILIVLDVILRNVFKTPIPGSYVIIESFVMPIAIFPALGYVYMMEVLPRLSEFVAKTPEWFQRYNKLLLTLMDIIIFSLLTYYTFVFFMNGYKDDMQLPVATNFVAIWPIYFFIPLGYFLVLVEVIVRFIGEFKKTFIQRDIIRR